MILTNELAVEMETKVSFIVNKYASSYNREDLMQAGKMGVIKAANNFDPTLGIKFSTFCEKYILGEVLKYLREDKNITNKEVTKETIKKGTSMAPDEACLSLKIFIGEVMELKDKCNAIFIPRLFSIKEHEQVCTNFNALYDLIHNLFPEVPLITSNIDLQKHKTEMKAYINIGKQLGYSVIATVTAYLKALDKDKKIREKNFLAQTEKLKFSK